MANFLWSLINLAALWFVAWPLAFFCSWIYILLSPFSACIEGEIWGFLKPKFIYKLLGCDKANDMLQKGVEWPRKLGKAIKNGEEGFAC